MKDKTQENQLYKVEIPDDAYVYRYGMTIKELREQIQERLMKSTMAPGASPYNITSVSVKFAPTIQMSSAKDQDEISEEEEQIDSDEWEVDVSNNPLYNQPRDWSKWFTLAPEDVKGTGHIPTEWDDEEVKTTYTPSWANEVVDNLKPKCEHKFTRDVELIFTTATECIDCGERLK